MMHTSLLHRLCLFLTLLSVVSIACADEATDDSPISFAKDIRPVLMAKCFGCHQGARMNGDYLMTDYQSLVKGGESGMHAIVPSKPDESYLYEQILPDGDERAAMPPEGNPLTADEVALVRKWIEHGAVNDFTRDLVQYSDEHPPTYSRQPNITSIDFSPDGKLLAVTGFHEVLLLDTSTMEASDAAVDAKIAKRLIGMSPRLEALQFSPDGARLAVSGGSPGESGEIQVWEVASGELLLSKTVSSDTVYGVSWSSDGKLISFGSTDTNLRAIDSETGEQRLFQGAHDDWIRDTVFSPDGLQLVSVGRDMSCKLTDVKTQRFIDNVTSITPGVLKGGIASIAMHPERNEFVIGGADGIAKIYRTNRLTKRVIGDDANLIKVMPAMPGRIQSVDVSADGKRLAAGSSLNGEGHLRVYSYEFDTSLPEEMKKILSKQPTQWNGDEKKKVEEYNTRDVREIAKVDIGETGIYAVAFHPERGRIVASGADGILRFYDSESGELVTEMRPVQVQSTDKVADSSQWQFPPVDQKSLDRREPPKGSFTLSVSPERIEFRAPTDYVQLVALAKLEDGSTIDVTQDVICTCDTSVASVHGSFIQVVGSGQATLDVSLGDKTVTIPITVELPETWSPDFVHDVNPVLTRLGCNQGTCHGSATGKNGFKLSLRGYDPIFDVRSFTDDMAARRTNLASPSDSLMLLKPGGFVAHTGGKLIDKDGKYYRLIHDWIQSGARLKLEGARVASVELLPANPILARTADRQQMRVVASYDDGSIRDVTREAFIEISDTEIASVDGSVVTASRRGESPVLARYEGAFTATTLTVMGDREGFAWETPESWGTVDELVAGKWQRMKIRPSGLCSDADFVRRVHLDLTGLPPTADKVREFLGDKRPTRVKRDALVDTLIGNEEFIDHWANKWADLLQVNRKYLGVEGAKSFRKWIRDQIAANRPYDEFAHDILTASGSNRENPAASYYKIHRDPQDTMENTTHLFLATRFNCNKCHDHPFERWTQDQYYETAAYFAQVQLEKDPKSGDKKIGGSAVESAKPLYEIVKDASEGEVKHDRTGQVAPPEFPFECSHDCDEKATRRQQLAAWITSSDNPYFATSYVNRLWGYLMGVGLIEPLDDIRAGNPPSNPALLEHLRHEFVESGFDTRKVLATICKSRAYQLSVETNPYNQDDKINYSHAKARRLPAEVLFDSIHFVTGSPLMIPGVEPGTRAAALPDSGAKLPSGFLSTLGRPVRESACECERANDLQLGSVLALVSGPDLSRAIHNQKNAVQTLVESEPDNAAVIGELFMRILNRPPTPDEIQVALDAFRLVPEDHNALVKQRDDRTGIAKAEVAKKESLRTKLVSEVSEKLDAAIKELDPELAKREEEHAKQIAAAAKALKTYETENGGFQAWKNRQMHEVHWHPLLVNRFRSKVGREAAIQSDRSVVVKRNKTGKDIYTVISRTDLTGIAAIRLELMPHDSLPKKGPGLAEANGNLVLTEFEFAIAHPDRPKDWQTIEVHSAVANHEQGNYPVANSFDKKNNDNKGWALGGNLSKPNWAVFQLKLPSGYDGGSLIRVKLYQTYDPQHQIGRFRISVSKQHGKVRLGLNEPLLGELAKPEGKWSKETRGALLSAFKRGDPKIVELQSALVEAKKPLMIDGKIVRLREKLKRVSMPVPPDAILTRLESDVKLSQTQLERKRITAAQDVAWALINSPAFLFNH